MNKKKFGPYELGTKEQMMHDLLFWSAEYDEFVNVWFQNY